MTFYPNIVTRRIIQVNGSPGGSVTNFKIGTGILDSGNPTAPTTLKHLTIVRAADGSAVIKGGGNTVTLTGIAPGR